MQQRDRFYEFFNIVLGGFVGFLISIPATMSETLPMGQFLPVLFIAGGLVTGYRRKQSRGFFYFALFCTLALLTLLLIAVQAPHPG